MIIEGVFGMTITNVDIFVRLSRANLPVLSWFVSRLKSRASTSLGRQMISTKKRRLGYRLYGDLVPILVSINSSHMAPDHRRRCS